MNRLLLLAVVGCGLMAGTASAQQADPMAPPPMGMTPIPAAAPADPVAGTVSGGCAGCGANAGYAHHDSRFGWNPLFKRLAFWKQSNTCGTCGSNGLFSRLRGLCNGGSCGGNGGYGAGPAFNPYPNGVPGTLVFPNHWYTRSPRDFFMMDAR